MELSISILGINFHSIEESLKPIAKKVEYLHMDVMDGNFVPNISFGPQFISSLRSHYHLIFDTHLMISNPGFYLKRFIAAGSDMITFHLEAVEDPMPLIEELHQSNVKAGIAINPNTPVEKLIPYLKDIDLVLVMSVEPGFGGQSFMSSAIDKVKKLDFWKKENNYEYIISIDGGITDKTLPLVKDYIDLAVSGSFVTNSLDPGKQIELLKHI